MIREYIEKQRENLLTQQKQALALYHQASGALAMIDDVIARMDEPEDGGKEAALDAVKKATGADSAELVKLPKKATS